MSQQDDACENALLRAIAEDPEVRDQYGRATQAQNEFYSSMEDQMNWRLMEDEIPAPGNWDGVFIDRTDRAADVDFWANKLPNKLFDSMGWQTFKQMRVALMLSNILTHGKNFAANTGQAVVVRPLEEGMSVLFSQRRGEDALHKRELFHYATGMLRATQDSLSVLHTLGKMGKQKGAFAAEDIKLALREAGYPEDLAMMSKTDLIDASAQALRSDPGDVAAVKGFKYILNMLFGSQFSALSGMDIAFKMISHRAKVQQLLSRQAVRAGHTNPVAWDEFVSTHWDEFSERIKASGELDEQVQQLHLTDIEKQGVKQAAEDTFTETPHTTLGKAMAHGWKSSNHIGFVRAFNEGMQFVAPFRAIYVNLMRQSISRRLIPFFDRKTLAELTGEQGEDMRDLALARVAGAWTLLGGTGLLLTSGDIKLHTRDDANPQIRDLQFTMEGKVGGTLQIGDWYYPTDALPPSIAFPLAWTAAAMKGVDEYQNWRYVQEEDRQVAFMKSLAPFLTAVTDGPWVQEYLAFLTQTNQYLQYGNYQGLGEYLASLSFSPMKPPRWMHDAFGVSPDIKTTDGFWAKIRTDWMDEASQYGYRRNMAGVRITPPKRMGKNLDKPYFGMDDGVVNFLNAIDYDKVSGEGRVSRVVDGQANDENGVPSGTDDVPMSPKAIDRFEYYIGQSRWGSDKTFEEELKGLIITLKGYDPDTGELRDNLKVKLQGAVKKLHSARRKRARFLVQYNPAFGIREKQIQAFYDGYVKHNGDPVKADKIRQKMLREMDMTRRQLERQKAF